MELMKKTQQRKERRSRVVQANDFEIIYSNSTLKQLEKLAYEVSSNFTEKTHSVWYMLQLCFM